MDLRKLIKNNQKECDKKIESIGNQLKSECAKNFTKQGNISKNLEKVQDEIESLMDLRKQIKNNKKECGKKIENISNQFKKLVQ